MSARPSRRHASKTDQAKQRLEQLKRLKEDGKKRLDDIDGDEDVANVYDEVGGFFVFVFSSLVVALFLIKSRAKRKVGSSRLNSKKCRAKKQRFRSEESVHF